MAFARGHQLSFGGLADRLQGKSGRSLLSLTKRQIQNCQQPEGTELTCLPLH